MIPPGFSAVSEVSQVTAFDVSHKGCKDTEMQSFIELQKIGTMDAGLRTMSYGRWTMDTGLWTLEARLWTLKL